MKYDYKAIEKKWQDIWDAENTFAAKQDFSLPKYYALVEFPYPSGQGLHVGHPRSYTALTSWRARSACAAITCCIPWAGTPSACPRKTTP